MVLLPALINIIKTIISISLGLIGIGFLIGLHELGHFLFCKLFNISTPSFSIGFGPHIWKKKIGETLFSLSAIPLGGYVEIAGSEEIGQGDQKEAKRRDNRSITSKPYWQKMLVMFGGIIFNLIFSYIVIISLFTLGVPKTPLLYPQNATNIIDHVREESPASRGKIKKGDIILSVNGHSIINHGDLIKTLEPLANQKANIVLERKGDTIRKHVVLDAGIRNGKDVGILGVSFELKDIPARPLGQAIIDGIDTTHKFMANVLGAIKGLFIKRSMNGVGGPLMIISATASSAHKGIKIFLLLLAFISANLAVLNMLPLPILDGGQALFYTIEAIIRRKLPEVIKLYIHYACWIGFLLLTVYLTYKDLGRIIGSWLAG